MQKHPNIIAAIAQLENLLQIHKDLQKPLVKALAQARNADQRLASETMLTTINLTINGITDVLANLYYARG